MDKGLKKCSTSTDVESVHHVHKVTNPQRKVNKRQLDYLEIEEQRKKQKKHNERSKQMDKSEKEIETLRKSLKDMTETVRELRQIIQTSADRPKPFRPKPFRNRGECNFENDDFLGHTDRTLFCQGFDTSVPRHEIKSALWKHFSSCGKVKRVYVPIECATGAALGFAFIDMKKRFKKGLKLNGSYLRGRKLLVTYGTRRPELFGLNKLRGCERCCHRRPFKTYVGYHYSHENPWRMVGTRFSKIGRFTALACWERGEAIYQYARVMNGITLNGITLS